MREESRTWETDSRDQDRGADRGAYCMAVSVSDTAFGPMGNRHEL